ncbi:hypothetical protein VTL71DRAFT_16562 [Oculimacula yallundae]|uniref:Uncharacterized protein n=1 Tax=Oculimacula yallundae TaxID=86028 RepID=A0ABR4CH11_9HELO
MAVDPNDPRMAEDKARYFPNPSSPLLKLDKSLLQHYLLQSTTRIIQFCPPILPWPSPFRGQTYRGFFVGPTAIAYLFYTLTLSPLTRTLSIEGKSPQEWAVAYLNLGQEDVPPLTDESCGITNEYLASNALKACVFKDEKYAKRVLDVLRDLKTDATWCEWLKGRAGATYLLRMMKHGLPDLSTEIQIVIKQMIEEILPQQPWSWDGRQYLGTVHGDIGIITQIVLSDPTYAPQLRDKLASLITQQGEDGNWPVVPDKDIGLVQFCHGAPGMIISLLAIRPYFPGLDQEIENAIVRGRQCIWERGLLVKEPNICHGITGNALPLEGEQREHFLAMATPDLVDEGVENERWEKDEDRYGVLWGEAGRAWVWAEEGRENVGEVEGRGEGRCPLFTDF